MSSSPMSAPLGFYSLSDADQKHKLRKKQQIEQHWGCSIDQVFPQAIRPRFSPGKSAKAKIGYPATEAEWWRWSADLFYKLENLAAITPGRLPFAQALMQAEVHQRHQDHTNNNRETAEIVKQDVIKIIAELRNRNPAGTCNSNDDDEDYEDGDGPEDISVNESEKRNEDGGNADGVEQTSSATGELDETNTPAHKANTENGAQETQVKIKTEPDDEQNTKRKLADGKIPAAKKRSIGTLSCPTASKEGLEMRANIASMRAAAARFIEQAAQREAKA